MMIEGKCGSNMLWVMCACLLGMAFSVVRAEDRPLDITLSVPKSVEEGMAVPVQVSIRNTSSKKIGVLDKADPWQRILAVCRRSQLRNRPFLGVSKLGAKISDSLPVCEHDATHHAGPSVEVYLEPGKTVTYNYQLRQIVAFPVKESGKYEVAFTWKGVIGKAQFSISKRSTKWKLIGRHELPLSVTEFYGDIQARTKEKDKARVELFVSPKGDKQRVIVRTTYPLDPGAIVLSEQASSVKRIEHAIIGGGDRYPAREKYADEKVREMAREYLAVAWVESGNLMYATFGHVLYGPRIMREHYPKAMRAVPAFSILCQPKGMKQGVMSIVHLRVALNDLVEAKVALKDGTASTLYVDAQGKVVKRPSSRRPVLRSPKDEAGRRTQDK